MTEPDAVTSGLYDRPVLVVDPGMHTAAIARADVDRDGTRTVTGSLDRTVRLWSLADGRLQRTIRLPTGPGNVGKVYAVAISPDGTLVAAGGWTRFRPEDKKEQIYLFDTATGGLVQRLEGLPNVVHHLVFSPDGGRLAAALGGGKGVRVYARDGERWAEAWRDADYGKSAFEAAFAADGRLATTSLDGSIRLYDAGGRRLATRTAPDGLEPLAIAFHPPEDDAVAVGYVDAAAVSLLDGHTLDPRPGPDTAGIDNPNLMEVAWSRDGRTLYAGGTYARGGTPPALVVAWPEGGLGARRETAAAENTIVTLAALPGGGALVAAGDPWLGVLAADGAPLWTHPSPLADFRFQERSLAISANGAVLDFGYEPRREITTRFDLGELALRPQPLSDGETAPARQTGLPIEGWEDAYAPTLDGAPLPLEPYERSRNLAIHPDGDRFVLGADWNIRAFDASGATLWRIASVPGVVWAVNISGDGRLVVAAYGDGTIRWHRMDDGRELLAFMPLADRTNWVAWTPEGFYAATPGAHGVLQWHVNHGWDEAAEAIPVSEIAGSYRPALLPLVLQEMETARALGLAELAEHRKRVQVRLGTSVPPGARLHVLTVGVSDYGAKARNLKLDYANKDAHDVVNALNNTQGSLYAEVLPQELLDSNATRAGILQAFAVMRDMMARGEPGRDLAVVLFSGHGAMIDDGFYLLVHGVDNRSQFDLRTTALPMSEVQKELHKLGELGRVLVLLDCCHSGAATEDGVLLPMNAAMLRSALATTNVTVLTSSSSVERSFEDERWQNGAFTEVFLEALVHADTDKNRLIRVSDLTSYLTTHVPRLTDGAQTPGVEVRFDSDIFVTGL